MAYSRYRKITRFKSKKKDNLIREDARIYQNIRYPEIPLSENDLYVFTTIGDSYDSLSFQYYNDSSYWWIFSIANPKLPFDSLYPPPGTQLRIPSNFVDIITQYEALNRN